MRAYHFTSDTLRDGRAIPPIGEWLEHDGEIVPCESGLHASVHPLDALGFAPGKQLHLVEIDGDIIEHGDNKIVGRRRKIIATIDAEDMLWEFARWCALQVIDLWDAPDIVREYLEAGDESKRAAAWAAARAAARDAAWAAAWAAARAAAWDAARAAARAAARDAARDAAWDAARAAAWDAARAAARDAARDAAWAAARDAQREKFQEMIHDAFATEKERH